jgi:hypothetical protein
MPSAFARKKKERSGKIDDNVYTDAKYKFKLTLPENWSAKLQKPDSDFRLILTQNDHEIPPALMPYPHKAMVPEVKVYITETKLDPLEFIDSLVSHTYKSDAKGDILGEIIFLEEGVDYDGLLPDVRKGIEIDEKPAGRWEGHADYTVKQGLTETTKRSYGTGFMTIAKGDKILVFQLSCERRFFPKVFAEVVTMAESLKW